jgi:hypothetical protein
MHYDRLFLQNPIVFRFIADPWIAWTVVWNEVFVAIEFLNLLWRNSI